MDGETYLDTVMLAGVTLAGFSAIAVALEIRTTELSETRRKAVISRLVERSLAASLFALLPTLLSGLGLSERPMWLIASGALAAYGASRLVNTLRNHRETVAQLGVARAGLFIHVSIAVAVIIVQVFNAIGLVLSQGLWWYALGVTWLLWTAGYTFVFYMRTWTHDS